MSVSANQPSFIVFLENVSNNILSEIKIEDYFELSPEKKQLLSFTVLNLIRNSAKIKANLSNLELKSFISVLRKKNEDNENYEFAAILDDVAKNFDVLNDLGSPKQPKKQNKSKTDKIY